MTEETSGIDSHAACLVDGLTDDYELRDSENSETLRKDKPVSYVR